MTEQEWLECSDPVPMLAFVGNNARRRKLQLFACACCRRIWKWMDGETRVALEAEEALAGGSPDAMHCLVSRKTFLETRPVQATPAGPIDARGFTGTSNDLLMNIFALGQHLLHNQAPSPQQHARRVVRFALDGAILEVVDGIAAIISDADESEARGEQRTTAPDTVRNEYREHANLLREILGNPFRASSVAVEWLTADVLMLARGIAEEQAFDRLPILADALQDAGCDDQDILDHCRSGGPHHAACWVLDLIFQRDMVGAAGEPPVSPVDYPSVYEEDPTDMFGAPPGEYRVVGRLHFSCEDYLVGDFPTRQGAVRWSLANVSTHSASRSTYSVFDDRWMCLHSISYTDHPITVPSAREQWRNESIQWVNVDQAERSAENYVVYRASVRGARLTIRVNDFPEELLYTLLVNGEAVEDFNQWPTCWERPA
jgi:hypothetical protein